MTPPIKSPRPTLIAEKSRRLFEWLDRSYRQTRTPGTPELKTDPLMKTLRQDPRFAKLLKRMHLSD